MLAGTPLGAGDRLVGDVAGVAVRYRGADGQWSENWSSDPGDRLPRAVEVRWEEHTSELQSLMRISYAGFCLKKKTGLSGGRSLPRSAVCRGARRHKSPNPDLYLKADKNTAD